MKNKVKFTRALIAPCGMNCGTCLGYQREKNRCPGCRTRYSGKAISVQRCIITKCPELEKTKSKFCYECPKFPCRRMKQLDKRYRTRYNTSFIDNLLMIRDEGIASFLEFETTRRTCPDCGSALCVHRTFCLHCKTALN